MAGTKLKPKMEIRKLEDLRPAEWNPRTISDPALAGLKASIERWGIVQPVIVNKRSGNVVGGHQRIKALQALGATETQVLIVDLPEAEEKALNVSLNNPHIAGEFTPGVVDLLENIKLDLPDLDTSLLGLDALFQDVANAAGELATGNTDPDAVPAAPKQSVVKPGDLWILGNHRILCGDSAKENDVKRLMAGEKAGLMNTDPPYGIKFDNAALGPTRKDYDAIENDDLCDEKLQAFLESVFRPAVGVALAPSAAWYLWHAHLTQGFFAAAAAAAAANVMLHRQIIWVKERLILGRGHYHWKHEPCFMGWVKGNQPPDYGRGSGERDQTTVWEIKSITQSERDQFNHASPKPVELFTIPMIKHLNKGEISYEPFSGSGPQIIAAEQTGRRCYAIEIAPQYVEVALKRWADFTGRQPVHADTKKTFEEVKNGIA